jgi:hypothetical protein
MWGALSDERTGLSFTISAGPRQRSHFWVRVPRESWPYFTVSGSRFPNLVRQAPVWIYPRNRDAQLYLQALGSLFVAFYDSQGYGTLNSAYIASGRTPRKTLSQECVLIGPLPSNGCPIVESVTTGLFTEPLPSNGHMRHNICPTIAPLTLVDLRQNTQILLRMCFPAELMLTSSRNSTGRIIISCLSFRSLLPYSFPALHVIEWYVGVDLWRHLPQIWRTNSQPTCSILHFTYLHQYYIGMDTTCRSQWPRGLRHELSPSRERWDRGFESL